MPEFSRVAAAYEKTSLVQRAAADELLKLIPFKGTEDVLDVGCAGGHITAVLRKLTKGRVAGTDVAEGMIEKAKEAYSDAGIDFFCVAAEDLVFRSAFDVVFCNSTFQWFTDPAKAVHNFRSALREGGRAVVQAPATRAYCPLFLLAIEAVAADKRTADVFSTFHSPWIFLETPRDYEQLFVAAGFHEAQASIRDTTSFHRTAEALGIFSTGAMVGYLDPANYTAQLSKEYVAAFKDVVRVAFGRKADPEGKVALTFNRVFLSASVGALRV